MTHVRAAVVGRNGDNLSLYTDDGYKYPLPAGVMHNGQDLLGIVSDMIGTSVTLMLPEPWLAADAATSIAEHGWKMTTPPEDVETVRGWSAWTTYYRPGKAIHVGVMSMIDDSKTPLFTRADDPRVISRRLCDFQRLMNVSYRITPGVTGGALLKGMYDRLGPGQQPLWQAVHDVDDMRGIGDLIWDRPRTIEEREASMIHAYDVHGAYLSAASMADLAWSRLEYRCAPTFNPALAGFWRVTYASCTAPKWSPWAPEIVPDTRVLDDGTVWITTPIARLLAEYGARLEIVDAWTAGRCNSRDDRPRTRRILRPWAERIRDARKNVGLLVPNVASRAAMNDTLKRVPNETVGLFNPVKGTGAILRADWAWTIRDLNRVNLLRKIHSIGTRTGRWPLRVKTDAVYYASHVDSGQCARMLGIELATEWGMGRWHYVGTTPAATWADPTELELSR